jgi:hypothetical protein
MRSLFALFVLLCGGKAHAFPEMIRHHYVNCNACHVNPNGGGLLTEYGRGMSGEVLSTWHYENESDLLHGLLKKGTIPEWLNVGGDVRALQLAHSNATEDDGRYILMQDRLEAAISKGPFTGDIAYFAPDALNHVHGQLDSFYLMGNVSDSIQVKGGRFLPAFGINDPHHILSTRQTLGFGYGEERNAVEGQYSGEQWHAALGWSESIPTSLVGEHELAGYGQIEKFISDSYRVGTSLWVGSSDVRKRWLVAIHGILGFTEHLYLTDETDWQNAVAKVAGVYAGPTVTGLFHFDRFGWEIRQGLHLTAISDISETDVTQTNSLSLMLGGGPVWYPRPHLEFELVGTKRLIRATSQDWDTYAWLMMHYYL